MTSNSPQGAPNCLVLVIDAFQEEKIHRDLEKMKTYLMKPDGSGSATRITDMVMVVLKAKKASPVWKELKWVPRSLISQRLFPERVSDFLPQLWGFGKFGWRSGRDDPILGIGSFLHAIKGASLVVHWPLSAVVNEGLGSVAEAFTNLLDAPTVATGAATVNFMRQHATWVWLLEDHIAWVPYGHCIVAVSDLHKSDEDTCSAIPRLPFANESLANGLDRKVIALIKEHLAVNGAPGCRVWSEADGDKTLMTLATEASSFWSSVRVTEKGVGANAEDASSASALPATGQVARRRLGSGLLSKSSVSAGKGSLNQETTPEEASAATPPVPAGTSGLSMTMPLGGGSSETVTAPSSEIGSEAPESSPVVEGNPAKKPRLSVQPEE